ncbi:nucleotidyltransferase family protein [Massilia sp. 9096]|uniref:nucleotidyltransferase domain-containing protein n=1 Tax=Massilia sp. 9096 TaxID=1500894 RepID=UPI000562F020|nr:nucleotidyltransferase family protein [Massilia sp. 9096]
MKRLPILVCALRDPGQVVSYTPADWDLLLRQSAATNLTPTLLSLIEARGLLQSVPAPARAHFDWVRPLAARHQQAVRFEVACIQAALQPTGLPLLLLKGAAYAMAGLEAGRGRLFGDIDLLVPKARLDDVEAALMLAGWAGTHHDDYDQRYYRQWMHELPPMTHVRRGSSIDVHHALVPETAPVRPDPDSLRARARPIEGMPGLATLAPDDMVLHSAVHLFFDGEFDKGLRDLFDLHRLLGEFGVEPGFWDGLVARARVLELGRPLFYALRHTTRMFGTAVPPAVLAAVAPQGPNPVLLPLMDWLFARALLPLHPSCDTRASAGARFLLYVRGNWLRMPPLLLSRHLFHKAFLTPRAAS